MNRANYTGALRPEQQFPLSTQGLDFIQQQIMLVSEFAKSAGGNYILSGAVTTGNTVSDGVLVLNGEIIRFVGGAKQSTIRIVEAADSVTANGLTYENAYVRRWAEFGSNVGGVDTFNWADITPIPTDSIIKDSIIGLNKLISDINGSLIGINGSINGINNTINAINGNINEINEDYEDLVRQIYDSGWVAIANSGIQFRVKNGICYIAYNTNSVTAGSYQIPNVNIRGNFYTFVPSKPVSKIIMGLSGSDANMESFLSISTSGLISVLSAKQGDVNVLESYVTDILL